MCSVQDSVSAQIILKIQLDSQKKTLKKMEKKETTYNPLLIGIKDKKLSIRAI